MGALPGSVASPTHGLIGPPALACPATGTRDPPSSYPAQASGGCSPPLPPLLLLCGLTGSCRPSTSACLYLASFSSLSFLIRSFSYGCCGHVGHVGHATHAHPVVHEGVLSLAMLGEDEGEGAPSPRPQGPSGAGRPAAPTTNHHHARQEAATMRTPLQPARSPPPPPALFTALLGSPGAQYRTCIPYQPSPRCPGTAALSHCHAPTHPTPTPKHMAKLPLAPTLPHHRLSLNPRP